MYSEKKHIIEKVFLEVKTQNEKEAHRIQNIAGFYAQEKLFPILEEVFEEFDKGTDIIRFDRLDINFSLKDWNDSDALKVKLLETTKTQLNKALNIDQPKEGNIEKMNPVQHAHPIVDPQQNLRETFLFYIKNGHLPWFGKQEYISEITSPDNWKVHLSEKSFKSELKKTLRNNPNSIDRLVFQFSNKVALDLIEAFNVFEFSDKSKCSDFVSSSETDFRNSFLKSLIILSVQALDKQDFLQKMVKAQIAKGKNTDLNAHKIYEEIKKLSIEMNRYFTLESVSQFFSYTPDEINKVSKELVKQYTDVRSGKGSNESADSVPDIKPTVQYKESESDENKSPFFDKGNQGILVKNAGLIILGPFLPTFLKQFGWIDEHGMIKKEARIESIQATNYLAIGDTSFFEGNLIFEKFLCGMPLQTPIPQKNLLKPEVSEEAENLLRQIIKNWPALKNTGPGGLRQMFLNRNGKLIQTENGFKLIVERKVQDILLDKLQWNISLLKLPWKDELLFIEW